MRTCDCLVGWHAHSTDVLDVQFSVDETSLFSLGADGKASQIFSQLAFAKVIISNRVVKFTVSIL